MGELGRDWLRIVMSCCAVLQGMFDSETSQMMTAAIFGLSTLISSYQVGGRAGPLSCRLHDPARAFPPLRSSHSTCFTRGQGIPKYKIGFARGKGWESWGKIG